MLLKPDQIGLIRKGNGSALPKMSRITISRGRVALFRAVIFGTDADSRKICTSPSRFGRPHKIVKKARAFTFHEEVHGLFSSPPLA